MITAEALLSGRRGWRALATALVSGNPIAISRQWVSDDVAAYMTSPGVTVAIGNRNRESVTRAIAYGLQNICWSGATAPRQDADGGDGCRACGVRRVVDPGAETAVSRCCVLSAHLRRCNLLPRCNRQLPQPARYHVLIPVFITFRVSRRRREMYCGHPRLCVCLSVRLSSAACLCLHYRPVSK